MTFAYRSGLLYVFHVGPLTLAPAAQIVVPASGDYVVETSKTVNVSLVAAPSTLTYSGESGTITDDDANYTITQAPFVKSDTGTSAMSFTCTAHRVVPVAPTVYLTFSDGSAVAGTDYNAKPTSVTFASSATA